MVIHSAGTFAASPSSGGAGADFRQWKVLVSRYQDFSKLLSRGSRARVPTHRRIRCLLGARLASDLPGLALVGRISHPLNDSSNFLFGFAASFPAEPALPGRTPHRPLSKDNSISGPA